MLIVLNGRGAFSLGPTRPNFTWCFQGIRKTRSLGTRANRFSIRTAYCIWLVPASTHQPSGRIVHSGRPLRCSPGTPGQQISILGEPIAVSSNAITRALPLPAYAVQISNALGSVWASGAECHFTFRIHTCLLHHASFAAFSLPRRCLPRSPTAPPPARLRAGLPSVVGSPRPWLGFGLAAPRPREFIRSRSGVKEIFCD